MHIKGDNVGMHLMWECTLKYLLLDQASGRCHTQAQTPNGVELDRRAAGFREAGQGSEGGCPGKFSASGKLGQEEGSVSLKARSQSRDV